MSTPERSPPTKGTSSDADPGTLTESNKNQVETHFTEEDEVNLLNSYLQIARSKNSHNNNTLNSPTLDQIQTALGRPTFSHSKIADKLHRLKLQYHKFARTKSLIKTPHHRQILDIGRTIWGKSPTPIPKPKPNPPLTPRLFSQRIRQRSAPSKNGVDLEKFPVLVGEFSRQFPGNGVWRNGMKEMEETSLKIMNEKWILLHLQQERLRARRAELLQRQFGIIQNSEHVN